MVFVKSNSGENNPPKKLIVYNEYDNLQHLTKKTNKKESIEPLAVMTPLLDEENAKKQLKDKTNQNSKFSMSMRRVFGAGGSVTNKVEVRD